jgi:hypothetical protein
MNPEDGGTPPLTGRALIRPTRKDNPRISLQSTVDRRTSPDDDHDIPQNGTARVACTTQ